MSSRRTLARGAELKVQTRGTVLNPAVSVCLSALQLNPATICSRPASVNGFSFCAAALKKGQRLMRQCAKVFQFPAPLWRVIGGGSSMRWTCNSIAYSFSFFLPFFQFLLLTLSLVFAILSWGKLAFTYRPVRGVLTFVCIIRKRPCIICKFYWRAWLHMHGITRTPTRTFRLLWHHLPSALLTLFFC